MNDELVKALRKHADWIDACGSTPEYAPKIVCDWSKDMRDAADAIEKLMAEIDHKDKVIQGLLTQIDRFSAETSNLQNRIEHQNATIDSLYKTIEKLTEQKENGK